jgi:hypothetical protein
LPIGFLGEAGRGEEERQEEGKDFLHGGENRRRSWIRQGIGPPPYVGGYVQPRLTFGRLGFQYCRKLKPLC